MFLLSFALHSFVFMTTFHFVRRTPTWGDDDKSADCLYAFRSQKEALAAAKASSDLTLKRYFSGYYTPPSSETVYYDKPAWKCTLETNAYIFHPFTVEVDMKEDEQLANDSLFAVVVDHRIRSIHYSFKNAHRDMKRSLRELVAMGVETVYSQYNSHIDLWDGDLLEVQEGQSNYNASRACYEVWTKQNPDREVYVNNYSEEEVADFDEYWSPSKLLSVEIASVPVGVWTEQDIQTGGFAWHWTEFIGGNSSIDSILAALHN